MLGDDAKLAAYVVAIVIELVCIWNGNRSRM
jgi:hypothetical protein